MLWLKLNNLVKRGPSKHENIFHFLSIPHSILGWHKYLKFFPLKDKDSCILHKSIPCLLMPWWHKEHKDNIALVRNITVSALEGLKSTANAPLIKLLPRFALIISIYAKKQTGNGEQNGLEEKVWHVNYFQSNYPPQAFLSFHLNLHNQISQPWHKFCLTLLVILKAYGPLQWVCINV